MLSAGRQRVVANHQTAFLTLLPIPGSARARRTVAQKRAEELGLSVPGNFPDVGLSGRMPQLLSPVREQHVGIGGEALECPGEFMILPGK